MQLITQIQKPYNFLLLLSALCAFLLSSCSKEYVDFPYNEIESFEVKDANGNALSASIVNNEIILYWPPYQEDPTTLTPTIVVSDRASISPASGTAINIKTDEPARYTVKAQDGTTKTYTLKLQINQPMISARLSLSADLVYNIGSSPTIGLSTQHILTDKTKTNAFLIDESNKETQLIIETLEANGISVVVPAEPNTGTYRIKIVSGIRTVTTEAFKIAPPAFGAIVTNDMVTRNIKRGEKMLLDYNVSAFKKYYSNTVGSFKLIDLGRLEHIITEVNFNELTQKIEVTIPHTVALGRIRSFNAYDKSGVLIGSLVTTNYTVTQ
ncbi:hypothetical protein ACR79T_17200 [Sphingobacterium spiritivorum]|uniref:hypothetical protein n=1 Tax=Sphingobacterium spiritivorum TaxID=258 RepID=UPI003DA621A8